MLMSTRVHSFMRFPIGFHGNDLSQQDLGLLLWKSLLANQKIIIPAQWVTMSPCPLTQCRLIKQMCEDGILVQLAPNRNIRNTQMATSWASAATENIQMKNPITYWNYPSNTMQTSNWTGDPTRADLSSTGREFPVLGWKKSQPCPHSNSPHVKLLPQRDRHICGATLLLSSLFCLKESALHNEQPSPCLTCQH